MASIDQIRASDGSANASVATIQSSRAPAASTIDVDTVAGINTNFIGSMGTPHTFVDPVTSETITVISEATAVDFKGHVDGTNLEIDTIAPGYTDAGSEVGDIVIIRPTTQWSDAIADVLDVSHDDDGTLKDGSVNAAGVLASNVVTTAKILDDNVTAPKIVGIDKSNLTTDSNPYKFHAYRNGAWIADSLKINLETEVYDTNGNFDAVTNFRYDVPVTGFYQINFCVSSQQSNGIGMGSYVKKNGTSTIIEGSHNISPSTSAFSINTTGAGIVQLTAADYLELFCVGAGGIAGKTGAGQTYMSGFLVSRT